MEENKITAITKEKTDVFKGAYKDALEILDTYNHQTMIRPEGTYYDGDGSKDTTVSHGAFGYFGYNECVHAYRI